MSSNKTTKYRKDYQPYPFDLETVSLCFHLQPEKTRVESMLQFQRKENISAEVPLVLDGINLKLIDISLDGQALAPDTYQQSEAQLTVGNLPDSFTLSITTEIDPSQNKSFMGLYLSGKMFCTQCEAEGFRRMTYFPDRPDVLSRFTCKLIADKALYPDLLSNGNPVDQGDLSDGRHFITWEDPFKKPAYLFALVAGKLAHIHDTFETQAGKTVDLYIYSTEKDIGKCHYAMQSLKDAMIWDEKVYGLSYDLDRYMIVATPDFNMGAMENKGLNIFNTKYVLADENTATDRDYQLVQAVIGHEYFHNWTGNRVTCQDWFQLSLKEGLTVFRDQEFTSDHHSRAVKRIDDVKIIRANQFAEDNSPMAHPVRPDSYEEMNNFYTVTVYNKGAEVIRMMHTLLGAEGFRRGIDLYFERHDGHAVTCDDFIAAMSDANQYDFNQFTRWYAQAGTPQVSVNADYDATAQTYTLHFTQETPETSDGSPKEPFHIPIKLGLVDARGQDLPLESADLSGGSDVFNLKAAKQSITFSGIASEPTPSLLRQFSAPVKLTFPYSEEALLHLFMHDQDPLNRWDAGQRLAAKIILTNVEAYLSEQSMVVPTKFIDACQVVLADDSIDNQFKASLLTLPSCAAIGEQCRIIHPTAVYHAHRTLKSTLAIELMDQWVSNYQANREKECRLFGESSVGKRKMRAVALDYMSTMYDPALTMMVSEHYYAAKTVTDRMMTLNSLLNGYCVESATAALHDFFNRYESEPLMIDKWLALQAQMERVKTTDRVKALLGHPAFDKTNPNKVYALLVSYMHNMRAFHQKDGAGYDLLAREIMDIDTYNPQVAARLTRGLMNWKRFDRHHQTLMQTALRRIQQQPKLSADVSEIVNKSLATEAAMA